MGISKGTVKTYLQLANQSIKSFVVEQMRDYPDTIFLLLIFLETATPFFKTAVSL
jgi:hypothetical protein